MNNTKAQSNDTSEEHIREYLKDNPGFFERNEDLLLELKLPHPSGQAVSLIERQVLVMRQRNSELRGKLNSLLANARENDRLFERTKRLVLALIECNELGDIIDALQFSFDKEFGIPHTQLILFTQSTQPCNARFETIESAQEHLGKYLNSGKTSSGNLSEEEINYLFRSKTPEIGSAAIALFGLPSPTGLIAIGHQDPERYRSGVGTLFLGHVAEVVGRLIAKHL